MMILGQTALPGLDGFLGSRGSFMLDVVFLAMFAVLPALAVSIALVKRRRYRAHKRLQLVLGVALLVTVVAFEVDMRWNGWEARAMASPYFDPAAKWSCPAGVSLLVHLFFAIPTTLLWTYVILAALRRYPSPMRPNAYSPRHKFLGWLATVEMTCTAITGWVFYWLAFVATK